MIELTQQQWQAVHEQSEVRLIDPQTNEAFVLIRAEAYDRLKQLLYDDSEFSTEEAFPLLNEMLGKEGWDDPAMDIYNDITAREIRCCRRSTTV
jgi:hypothetical protein